MKKSNKATSKVNIATWVPALPGWEPANMAEVSDYDRKVFASRPGWTKFLRPITQPEKDLLRTAGGPEFTAVLVTHLGAGMRSREFVFGSRVRGGLTS